MTAPRLALLALLAVACSPTDMSGPSGAALGLSRNQTAGTGQEITVMAQNLYVGANVDLVIGALLTPSPDDDLGALLFAIETLGKTDYPARAEAIAATIARNRPHAVGLQEVSDIDIDLTVLGGPAVHLKFLDILQASLRRRGLDYQVAATVKNTDVQLVGGLVRLVDRDVLLVDAGRVGIESGGGQNFTARIPPEAVGGIALLRGWVWAVVAIDGVRYRIVSLHAEANLAGQSLSLLRAGQMLELVSTLPTTEPAILMGDFNDAPGSPMYHVLEGAGFTDVWRAMRPGVVGNTCCHADDLSDKLADFTQRIDYVFARGFEGNTLFGKIDRYGEVPTDRVAGAAYSVWPSDHAGLVATLR